MIFIVLVQAVNLKLTMPLSKKYCITFQTVFTSDDVNCHFDYKKRLCRELLIVALIKRQAIKDQKNLI